MSQSVVSRIALLVGLALTSQVSHAELGTIISGCPMFPGDNIWNTPIDNLPLDANSAAYIATIGASAQLKADFGSGLWEGAPIGIPYDVVSGTQAKVPVSFDYASESDPGPYPIPSNATIEGGSTSTGDRHVLVLDKDNCKLYETWSTYPNGTGWRAGSGAIWDMQSNKLRTASWTSADAAGFSVLAGLVRYDEVAAGEIRHALRFTINSNKIRNTYTWPATHKTSNGTASTALPQMGQRFRLKSSFDISNFSAHTKTILKALKKYGMMIADGGSDMYLSGQPHASWNNTVLNELKQVTANNFEAVDVSSLKISADSGRAKQLGSGWSVAATTSGTLTNLSLSLTVTPVATDVGKTGALYVAALSGKNWYTYDGSSWKLYTSGVLPAYATLKLTSSHTIELFNGNNATSMKYAQIYAGYGLSLDDMVTRNLYRGVYTIE